jgi:hypothetical protein
LKVQAFSYVEYYLRKRLEAKDKEPLDNQVIKLAIRNEGLEFFP